LLTCVWHV